MTTITIKNGTLKEVVFQTVEDLSADSQKAIEESKEKGLNDLFDF